MLTLGIETSCDETGVSVTDGRRVYSNIVSSSIRLHKRYGGVVPEIASRYHVEYMIEVANKALAQADRALKEMRLIAVTSGPGLVGSLLTGISFAKAVSYGIRRPLIGVNHILAHLYSALLSEDEEIEFPFIGLVVSGGHTALFYCGDIDRYTMLGQTQDDAVGEAYDKVAKILGLGYPGGPIIERMARKASGEDTIKFPRTYLGKDSLDFSFSGIKTAVLYYVRKTGITETNDICRSFQEAACDVLVDKAFLAARKKNAKCIVVGGGVAVNSRLRERFYKSAKFENVKVHFPKKEYCMDNAAMVGTLGEALYKKGHKSDYYLSAEPNLEAN